MHPSRIVFLINDAVTAVKAKYDDTATEREVVFKTMLENVAVGDLLVVQAGTRLGFTTVKVTEIDVEPDLTDNTEIRWAIQKVDMKAAEEFLAEEKEAIATVQAAERKRKKAELRATMLGGHEDMVNQLKLASPIEE